jgi:hypothetical protein
MIGAVVGEALGELNGNHIKYRLIIVDPAVALKAPTAVPPKITFNTMSIDISIATSMYNPLVYLIRNTMKLNNTIIPMIIAINSIRCLYQLGNCIGFIGDSKVSFRYFLNHCGVTVKLGVN